MFTRMRSSSLAVALSGLMLTAPVGAQEAGSSQAQQQAQHDYSEKKLEAFAAAATEVNKIMFAWRGRMQQAENQEEQQQMLQQANEEIVAIVQETPNINMQEYQEIATAAGEDQALAEELRNRVREKMEGTEGTGGGQ